MVKGNALYLLCMLFTLSGVFQLQQQKLCCSMIFANHITLLPEGLEWNHHDAITSNVSKIMLLTSLSTIQHYTQWIKTKKCFMRHLWEGQCIYGILRLNTDCFICKYENKSLSVLWDLSDRKANISNYGLGMAMQIITVYYDLLCVHRYVIFMWLHDLNKRVVPSVWF